jgi:hypothetical protein
MSNHIRGVEVFDVNLAPAQVELWVRVTLAEATPAEVRGRFMGPRCLFASTVEVAYPLVPLARQTPLTPDMRLFRVIIPEASLWEPESPFLYEGIIELWEDGVRRQQVRVSHGLRQVKLGADGVRINGRSLKLRGKGVTDCTEEQALALRRAGVNLLVVPLQEDPEALWSLSDRFGFLVLSSRGAGRGTRDAGRGEGGLVEDNEEDGGLFTLHPPPAPHPAPRVPRPAPPVPRPARSPAVPGDQPSQLPAAGQEAEGEPHAPTGQQWVEAEMVIDDGEGLHRRRFRVHVAEQPHHP